jgi:hypothetical protein
MLGRYFLGRAGLMTGFDRYFDMQLHYLAVHNVAKIHPVESPVRLDSVLSDLSI